MSQYSLVTRPFICAIVMLFATSMSCFNFYPLTYTQSVDNLNVDSSDTTTNMRELLYPIEYNPSLKYFFVKEYYNSTEVNQIINSSFRDSNRLLCGSFNMLSMSSINLGLHSYAILSPYRSTKQNTSVIAISMGGHSPPTSEA